MSARLGSFVLLAFLAISALGPALARARGPIPTSFFGVSPQEAPTFQDYVRMAGVVGTLRIPIYWMQCEPRPGEFDFHALDEVIGRASEAGIRVLPFVYGSPSWVAPNPARPPLRLRARVAWASFLRALVHRYGPGGEFWVSRAVKRPIHRWQIWNEPNFPLFWAPRSSPKGYARLLSASASPIRQADPHAKIVLAGLAPIEGEPYPWVFLRRLYAVTGFADDVDIIGLHPYSSSLDSLRFQIEQTRATMRAAGDRAAPLEITEFGVASDGLFKSTMIKTPQGQAIFLRRAYRLLIVNRRRWHISSAHWFTWRDWPTADPHCVFCQYAGLFDTADRPKPAWGAYRSVVDAVSRKGK